MDILAVAQDHSSISGDLRELPLSNEQTNIDKKIDQGNKLMKKYIHEQV